MNNNSFYKEVHISKYPTGKGGFGFTLREIQVSNAAGPPPSSSTVVPIRSIYVKEIRGGGPADLAGLKEGDKIISVLGIPVEDCSFHEVVDNIRKTSGTVKLLVLPKEKDNIQMLDKLADSSTRKRIIYSNGGGLTPPTPLLLPTNPPLQEDVALHPQPKLAYSRHISNNSSNMSDQTSSSSSSGHHQQHQMMTSSSSSLTRLNRQESFLRAVDHHPPHQNKHHPHYETPSSTISEGGGKRRNSLSQQQQQQQQLFPPYLHSTAALPVTRRKISLAAPTATLHDQNPPLEIVYFKRGSGTVGTILKKNPWRKVLLRIFRKSDDKKYYLVLTPQPPEFNNNNHNNINHNTSLDFPLEYAIADKDYSFVEREVIRLKLGGGKVELLVMMTTGEVQLKYWVHRLNAAATPLHGTFLDNISHHQQQQQQSPKATSTPTSSTEASNNGKRASSSGKSGDIWRKVKKLSMKGGGKSPDHDVDADGVNGGGGGGSGLKHRSLSFSFESEKFLANSLENCRVTYNTGPGFGAVPEVIFYLTSLIEAHGLEHAGLYRIPGSKRNVNELKDALALIESSAQLDEDRWSKDLNSVTSFIKEFIRSLREPLLPTDVAQALFQVQGIVPPPPPEKMSLLFRKCLHQLRSLNLEFLKFFLAHLRKIAAHAETNKMDIENLAVCFGPCLIKFDHPSVSPSTPKPHATPKGWGRKKSVPIVDASSFLLNASSASASLSGGPPFSL